MLQSVELQRVRHENSKGFDGKTIFDGKILVRTPGLCMIENRCECETPPPLTLQPPPNPSSSSSS